ncbi:MAG: UDP-N-acetylmuramate--L-alanine ligase [Candidatus Roizmanbacteria bacterium]
MVDISKYNHILFIGVKGVAMANLAIILKQSNKEVSGVDVADEFITDIELKENEIQVQNINSYSINDTIDLVVYGASHGGKNNTIIQQAIQKKISIITQAELIGHIVSQYSQSIAVCGCHGKTNTTSFISFLLHRLRLDPTYLVGSSSFSGLPAGHRGSSEYIVYEADEYGVCPPDDKTSKLLYNKPKHVLCLNLDHDHPDMYPTFNDVKDTFLQYFNEQVQPDGNIYINGDDVNLNIMKNNILKKVKTYGFNESNDIVIRIVRQTEEQTTISLTISKNHGYARHGQVMDPHFAFDGINEWEFDLPFFGKLLVANCAGAIGLLLEIGCSGEEIQKNTMLFTGVKRRFEEIYHKGETWIFDDYAHHPTEIQATLQAVRLRFPKKRIVVVFQPHTFSRTKLLASQFAESLACADIALIAPIYPSAREKFDNQVSSEMIEEYAKSMKKNNVKAFSNICKLTASFSSILQKGDVVFTMGAGDIYKLKNDIIRALE